MRGQRDVRQQRGLPPVTHLITGCFGIITGSAEVNELVFLMLVCAITRVTMCKHKKEAKVKSHQMKEQAHFDKLAETQGEIWWGNTTAAGIKRYQRRVCLIAETLSRFDDPAVLELGCGVGGTSKFLLEELPLLHLIACDVSPKALQIAAARCTGYEHAYFEVADVISLSHPSGTFDAVIGNSILHHVPVEKTLHECIRVLKRRGHHLVFRT
jgi:ubiquinone/menaquinone biosynthesis C-methylase UbiE